MRRIHIVKRIIGMHCSMFMLLITFVIITILIFRDELLALGRYANEVNYEINGKVSSVVQSMSNIWKVPLQVCNTNRKK